MSLAIEVKNLNKSYKDFSLKNINLEVPKGVIMGFIGENGAGKTTTINSIIGAIIPNSGDIRLFGENPIENAKIKEDIAVVFDQLCLAPTLNARDAGMIMLHTKKGFDLKLYDAYLKRFKLPKNKKVKEFSKGMTMKLSLAMALSSHPKLLILDEATSGLDPVIREEILDILLEFIQNEEHSVFLSSHITSDLDKVADYITFIHDGEIVFSKSRIELNEEYAQINLSQQSYDSLDKSFILKERKNQFSCTALINRRNEFKRRYPDIEAHSVSTEEIMLYYSRGNSIERRLDI